MHVLRNNFNALNEITYFLFFCIMMIYTCCTIQMWIPTAFTSQQGICAPSKCLSILGCECSQYSTVQAVGTQQVIS